MVLTSNERAHWRQQLEARISKKIGKIEHANSKHLSAMRDRATEAAIKALGIGKQLKQLEYLELKKQEIDKDIDQIEHALRMRMPAKKRKNYYSKEEVANWIDEHRDVVMNELMTEDKVGQEILRLQDESAGLEDSFWLATSPAQITEIWKKVAELLGEKPGIVEAKAISVGETNKK